MENTYPWQQRDTPKRDGYRLAIVLLGAIIVGLNLNSFVHFGGLIPGGFTGLAILIQKLVITFFNVEIPYSFINIPLNLALAIICFKYIGKRFAVLSIVSIVISGLVVDLLPYYEITYDPLLTSIFGGIINGFAIALTLRADATTGGTDFISALSSKKYGVDAFNYILAGNACMLTVAGVIYGWEAALYSIIYQFATTQMLHLMYKRYQKHTLFIITEKPQEVYEEIRNTTNHGATLFKGTGFYKNEERNLVYSVIASDELHLVIRNVKKADSNAFIDVIHSDRVDGWFFQRPTT